MGIVVKPVKSPASPPGCQRVAAEITHNFWRKEQLYFDIPEACVPEVDESGNAWLVALLSLAFQTGGKLKICAPVDPVLLRNAGEIMRIWSRWYPSLKPVPIEAEESPVQDAGGGRTGLFFTGGVDSFYSLLHRDEAVRSGILPGARPVDDLILIRGFDIPLKNRVEFERKQRRMTDAARELGKNLITVTTNLRETRLRKVDWGSRLHGPALAAVGLLLGKQFAKMLISSGITHGISVPWGSHREVDPLMSASRTETIHYGASVGRFEKTAFISRSDIALRYLHVCWEEGSDKNCGKCEKCYRTLLALELLGMREKTASFPSAGFSLGRMETVWKKHHLIVDFYREMRKYALEHARPDVVAAIDGCLALGDAG